MQNDILLTRYVQDGSEAAFAQIIARHLPLVYRTCLRDIGSSVEAEDAAQVVFLMLARKASSLSTRTSLAGWLYHTSLFVAKNVRKQEMRRQRREEALMQDVRNLQPVAPSAWESIEPAHSKSVPSKKLGVTAKAAVPSAAVDYWQYPQGTGYGAQLGVASSAIFPPCLQGTTHDPIEKAYAFYRLKATDGLGVEHGFNWEKEAEITFLINQPMTGGTPMVGWDLQGWRRPVTTPTMRRSLSISRRKQLSSSCRGTT